MFNRFFLLTKKLLTPGPPPLPPGLNGQYQAGLLAGEYSPKVNEKYMPFLHSIGCGLF